MPIFDLTYTTSHYFNGESIDGVHMLCIMVKSMACQFHHRLIENMVKIIADKNRDLIRKVVVVSKRTIREKLLAYLSIQAQLQNSRYFEIPLGRVELAEYLCVDRSALTRELAKMKEDGLIDYDKNCFRIL